MQEKVKKQIEEFHMLEKGDRVLVGLSGGADSICLLQMLYLLKEEYELEVGAAHCHHGIRGKEADEDAAFARDFCEKRGIPFYFVKEEVEKRARQDKLSVEEAGRKFRYETFERLMKEKQYNKLAVAHNANDRAETMLFHLARGTDLAGLSAMEPIRRLSETTMLIRPLLRVERSEIEAWLLERELEWRTDQTNLSDLYTRNKIRHGILPELEKINGQAVAHMGKTAQSIREAVDYLKIQEEQACREVLCKKEKDSMVLAGAKLQQFHPYLQKSVLYHLLAEFSGGRKDLTSVHVELLRGLLEGESGRELSLARQVRVRKEYDQLIFFRGQQEETEGWNLAKKTAEWEITVEKIPFCGQEISKKKYTKFFDCGKIKNKLCLRFREPGDYLYLKEGGGRKKLNRYFIDEKIPPSQRERIPVLADGNHIVWIVGYRISAYYKVTAETKDILSVTIRQQTRE